MRSTCEPLYGSCVQSFPSKDRTRYKQIITAPKDACGKDRFLAAASSSVDGFICLFVRLPVRLSVFLCFFVWSFCRVRNICFIHCINIVHDVAMCRDPFPGKKSQRSRSYWSFEMKVTSFIRDFLQCPLRGSILIWLNHFIYGIYTTHEGMVCRALFSGWKVKGQAGTRRSKFYRVRFIAPSLFHLHFVWDTHTTHGVKMCRAPFPPQRVKGQGHTGHLKFLTWPLRGFLLLWPNHFIYGIHTTHEEAMCHAPFSRRKVNGQGHMGGFKFWPCPHRGFFLIWWNDFICGIHTIHEGTMCCSPFSGRKVKVQNYTSHLIFSCPLRGVLLIWPNHFIYVLHLTHEGWCVAHFFCHFCSLTPCLSDCPLADEGCRSYKIFRSIC